MPDPFASYVAGADPFAAFVSADMPLPPDPRVVELQDRLDPTTANLRGIYARNHGLKESVQAELNQAGDELPWALGGAALGAVLPGILAKIAPYAPRAVNAVAKIAGSPVTGGVVGAAEGYRHGGVWGALTGGAAGYGVSKGLGALAGGNSGPDVAAGMSQAGRAAQAPQTSVLDALMRGAKYDELAGLPDVQAAAARIGKASAPAVPSPAPSTLLDEVAARAKLSEPINWRTTDVTPLKQPGKGIHFGEESTPGLLKMLQDAQLAKNQPLVDKLLTAIRQRSHITGKVGGP